MHIYRGQSALQTHGAAHYDLWAWFIFQMDAWLLQVCPQLRLLEQVQNHSFIMCVFTCVIALTYQGAAGW